MEQQPKPIVDTVVVVTGGDPVRRATACSIPAHAFVIAADSGVEHAQRLGLAVDLAIGDFDSVSPAALAAALEAGAAVERHPTAKDATDLELALDAAMARRPRRIVVVGGGGGRLDHFLANALLLASSAYTAVEVSGLIGDARIDVVRSSIDLRGRTGELVSLLALGGPARSVATEGLRFPLRGEDLLPGSSRGVSNEFVDGQASVRLDGGVLVVVRPEALRASGGDGR